MENRLHSLSHKTALPPGTLSHVGRPKQETTSISIIIYDPQECCQIDQASLEDVQAAQGQPGLKWYRVQGLGQIETLQRLGEMFGVHRLALEDVLNTFQRPKLEDFDDYLFMVFKAIIPDGPEDSFQIRQLSLVVNREFILSFEEEVSGLFDPLLKRIIGGRGRIRQMSSDYLAYAILDVVVDNYFSALETLGDRLEPVEEEMMTQPGSDTLQNLYHQKRMMIQLRKAILPLREISSSLLRDDSGLISERLAPYLRDLHDHVIQVIDTFENLRENLSALSDLYLSSLNNRMNEVMKVLTIIATIFIPITFVAGLYGMNFKFMPELEKAWAYPAVLVLMGVVAGGLVVFFKTRKWM